MSNERLFNNDLGRVCDSETSITVRSSPVILDTFLMSQCVPRVVSVMPYDTTRPLYYIRPCRSKPLIVSEPLIHPDIVSFHPLISHAILLRPCISTHPGTKLPRIA